MALKKPRCNIHPDRNRQPERVCVKMRSRIVLLKYASCFKLRDDGVAKWAACTASQKLWNGENVRAAFPRNQWYFYRWVPGTSAEGVQMQSAADQCLHSHLTGSQMLYAPIAWESEISFYDHNLITVAHCHYSNHISSCSLFHSPCCVHERSREKILLKDRGAMELSISAPLVSQNASVV